MQKTNMMMTLLPTAALALAFLSPAADAKTMSKENACHFDKMELCVSLAGSEADACDVSRDPFTIMPIAIGTGSMAFRIDDDNGRGIVRGTADMMGYGMHFQHGGKSHAMKWNKGNAMIQIVRDSVGKPMSAETWSGQCTLEEVDVDAIEDAAR